MKDLNEFITEAITKYKNTYNYDHVKFIDKYTKVKIICSKHGEFFQTPKNHMKATIPCEKCSYENRGLSYRNTFEKFKNRMYEIHGDKIILDKFEYKTNKVHGICICAKCQTEWLSRPDILLADKSHCPNCKKNSIYTKEYYLKHNIENHPCYLYLVEFKSENELFLKIGISKNIKYRFRKKIPYKVNVISFYLTDFFTAYDLEQEILDEYKNCKYIPDKKFKGHTECLNISLSQELQNKFKSLVPLE